jgi:hypothetical protein
VMHVKSPERRDRLWLISKRCFATLRAICR